MKRIVLRECYDGRWSATYEDAHEKFVIPIHFTTGDTAGGAFGKMHYERPESEHVPVATVYLQK